VLSPNDVRTEEGWPASIDPTANSIEPLTAGGKPADTPVPADQGKVARLDQRRARHGNDD
jgi:hypothetical protein